MSRFFALFAATAASLVVGASPTRASPIRASTVLVSTSRALATPAAAHEAVRVVIGSAPYDLNIPSEGRWSVRDAWGRVHARASDGDGWHVERRNRRLRLTDGSGARASAWSDEPFVLASEQDALVPYGTRHYRGTIAFVATDTAILVINRVTLDDYLRGVVPIEIGTRSPNDSAAVQAQAIAARSYTVARQGEARALLYDLTSAATDQVYGGADVEQPGSDAAVRATAGMVLSYNGRVVRAPYHSTCGGQTASPSEVWQGANDEGYLRSVSDRVAGSDRAWCDISPRFRWERSFDRTALEEAVDRYVRANGTGMLVAGGAVRAARIEQETPSGRVGLLALDTDGGTLRLRGNAIRFALRGVGGEILNSTYFSLEPVIGRDGRLMQLTLRGAGNGHGIGMCQWGAIGRARAGHDVRAILAAYYPGTVLIRLP